MKMLSLLASERAQAKANRQAASRIEEVGWVGKNEMVLIRSVYVGDFKRAKFSFNRS